MRTRARLLLSTAFSLVLAAAQAQGFGGVTRAQPVQSLAAAILAGPTTAAPVRTSGCQIPRRSIRTCSARSAQAAREPEPATPRAASTSLSGRPRYVAGVDYPVGSADYSHAQRCDPYQLSDPNRGRLHLYRKRSHRRMQRYVQHHDLRMGLHRLRAQTHVCGPAYNHADRQPFQARARHRRH